MLIRNGIVSVLLIVLIPLGLKILAILFELSKNMQFIIKKIVKKKLINKYITINIDKNIKNNIVKNINYYNLF